MDDIVSISRLYKFERICTLEESPKLTGYEILSASRHHDWVAIDRRTLTDIGKIDTNLIGNVSLNLCSDSIINLEDSVVQKAALARPGLILEWVENACTQRDLKLAAQALKRWRKDFGIRISIDDIGKGQDGTERFLAVIPDFAKIEGTLLHHARHSPQHRRVIKHLCEWCRGENVPTVIEWVESFTDLQIAIDCGGVYGQGYHFERMK